MERWKYTVNNIDEEYGIRPAGDGKSVWVGGRALNDLLNDVNDASLAMTTRNSWGVQRVSAPPQEVADKSTRRGNVQLHEQPRHPTQHSRSTRGKKRG